MSACVPDSPLSTKTSLYTRFVCGFRNTPFHLDTGTVEPQFVRSFHVRSGPVPPVASKNRINAARSFQYTSLTTSCLGRALHNADTTMTPVMTMTVTDTMNAPNCASVTSRYAVAMDHHAATWSVRATNSAMSTRKVEKGNMRNAISKLVVSGTAAAAVVVVVVVVVGEAVVAIVAAVVVVAMESESVTAGVCTGAAAAAAVSLLALLFFAIFFL